MQNENTRRGFTLIELLVVVLIIGVLAAVAVPQYQRAVLKSRFTALMPIGKTLANANEAYYLQHLEYASAVADLPVEGQAQYPDGTAITLYSNPEDLSFVRVRNSSIPNAQYVVYQKMSKNFPDTTWCEAGDTRAEAMCAALGGVLPTGLTGNSSGTDGWKAYLLSGDSAGGHFTPACPANATCDNSGQVTSCGEGYYVKNNACSTYEHVGRSDETCVGDDKNCDNSGFLSAACAEGAFCKGSTFDSSAWCSEGADCSGSTFSDRSFCEYDANCSGSTFSRAGCYATCMESTFSEGSICDGDCTGSIFNDSSSCHESATCTGATFRDNALCAGTGCDTATYEGQACCAGSSCPSGVRKCVYDANTDSFVPDGYWD